MSVDPIAREGLWVDEIFIDEYENGARAIEGYEATIDELVKVAEDVTVMVVEPEPRSLFRKIGFMARVVSFVFGARDSDHPTNTWKADNTAIWPDTDQMTAARAKPLDDPLFVYNLNKNRPIAEYGDTGAKEKEEEVSGEVAYSRYAKVAGFQLLRRGAHPVYGGTPLGFLRCDEESMLADEWSHFIFVRYPQRRNLLSIIEGKEFSAGQHHRDAALERVAIFMGDECAL